MSPSYVAAERLRRSLKYVGSPVERTGGDDNPFATALNFVSSTLALHLYDFDFIERFAVRTCIVSRLR